MVIERFKGNNPNPVGERFAERGRMMLIRQIQNDPQVKALIDPIGLAM
jgi:hypothetical protein